MRKFRPRRVLVATAVLNAVIALTATPLLGVRFAANIFLALLTVKAVVFVVLYAARSNWRATAAGRAVMALIACLGTICAIGVVSAFLGDYPGRAYVRLSAFIAIGLVLMNLLLTLVEAQRAPVDRSPQ